MSVVMILTAAGGWFTDSVVSLNACSNYSFWPKAARRRGSNRPKAVIPRVRNQGRFIHRWFDMQLGGIPYGASANDSATIMHDDTT